MKRSILIAGLLISVFALFSATSLLAQEGHKIVTRTRLQVLFGDAETQWLKAIQQKDAATLNRLLGEEFLVWTPGPQGPPMSREEWQEAAFKRPPQSFRIENIAVRSVNPTVSVANFELTETFGQGDSAQTETYFVVDVWVNSSRGDNWKCSDRYISRVTGASQNVKGDVRPTGKD